jgi:CSLREA domain-containing protein
VRVDDGNGGVDTAATTLIVTNTAPTITVTGPSATSPGSTYTVDLSVTDPGADTVTAWHIDWGDGTFETILGNPSTASHVYTHRRPMPIRAAVVDEDGTWFDGDVFLADFALDRPLQLEANTGDNVRTFPATPSLDGAADALVGPDGLLYVSGYLSDTVVRYDPADGSFVDTFVTAGSGGLNNATGMVFAPDGSLLVAGYESDSIERYDAETGAHLGTFAAPGTGGLDAPIAMTYGPDGNLYVANWLGRRVIRFDPDDGTLLGTFASGVAVQPTEIVFGPDGDLYLVGRNQGRLDRHDGTTGAYLGTVTTASTMFGLEAEPDGTLLIGREVADRLDHYQLDGTFLGPFADSADGITQPWLFTREPSHWVVVDAFVVNSTGDAGDAGPGDGVCDTGATNADGDPECTLRAAIAEANSGALITGIEFAIPIGDAGHSAGVWTIQPGTALPSISAAIAIDGRTQPGWTTMPVVELDGGTIGGTTVDGLTVSDSSTGARIAGLAIVAFPDDGIAISGDQVVVVDNHIGVRADGVTAAGNGSEGIVVQAGAADAEIRDNVISGQVAAAAVVLSASTTGTTVAGNLIGTAADATTLIGNQRGIWTATTGTAVIGGPLAADANLITGSVDDGVAHVGTGTVSVIGNSIFANGDLAIDLADDGVTPNDPGDADTGPNGLLNFPELRHARELAGVVIVDVDLDVHAGDHLIEFFVNPSGADPTGYGEAEQFVHRQTVTHTGGGVETFTISFNASVGDVLTATATDFDGAVLGATSELSLAVTVADGTAAIVNSTGDADDIAPGDGRCDTGTTNANGLPECTLRAAITEANAAVLVDRIDFAIPAADAGHSAGYGRSARRASCRASPAPSPSTPVPNPAGPARRWWSSTALRRPPLSGCMC